VSLCEVIANSEKQRTGTQFAVKRMRVVYTRFVVSEVNTLDYCLSSNDTYNTCVISSVVFNDFYFLWLCCDHYQTFCLCMFI
jgi:hypothetical protein